MSSTTYKVLGSTVSTCTQTVLATLEEVGASYEFELIDVVGGGTRHPDFLAKYNPFGQIPALVDGDLVMFESRAIARYIALKHGAKTLYPIDEPQQAALVEQWLSVNQSNNGPVFETFSEYFVKPLRSLTPDASRIDEFKLKMDPYLTILDNQLAKTRYLAGENYTLADLSFVSMTRTVLACDGFGNTFDKYPNLKRWWSEISERKAWKKIRSAN